MRPYTIAILECDRPLDPVVEKYGTYGDIFEQFLCQALVSLRGQDHELPQIVPRFIKVNSVQGQEPPPLADIDALLLTGSKHNSFDEDPWILRVLEIVREAEATGRIALVGICFGHQIIARALGGAVGRSKKGWELSVCPVHFSHEGATLFGQDMISLHQMHRDEVTKLPPNVVNMGSSPVSQIQGLYRKGRIFSLQAHPEFNEFIMKTILETRHGQKIIDTTSFEAATARNSAHEGNAVGMVIWRFLLDQ